VHSNQSSTCWQAKIYDNWAVSYQLSAIS